MTGEGDHWRVEGPPHNPSPHPLPVSSSQWHDFMDLGNDIPDSQLDQIMESQRANQCAVIIYTSGTSGNPKGVMLSHDNVSASGDEPSANVTAPRPVALRLFLFSPHWGQGSIRGSGPLGLPSQRSASKRAAQCRGEIRGFRADLCSNPASWSWARHLISPSLCLRSSKLGMITTAPASRAALKMN